MVFEIGRLCIKLAGRDANKRCIIIDNLENGYVLIDGSTRRKKCNIKHLEPLDQKFKIKKNATKSEIIKIFKSELKINLKEKKSKTKKQDKPKKVRTIKEKVNKPKTEKTKNSNTKKPDKKTKEKTKTSKKTEIKKE